MQCLINPKWEKGEPLLNGPVLFYLNPGEASRAGRLAEQLGGRRHFMFNTNLWEMTGASGSFYVCGPAVGAPMAVLVLEKLIALGGVQVIVCGTCGSLRTDLAIGEVLLPDRFLSEEGTSWHYPLSVEKPSVSLPLVDILTTFLKKSGISWRIGGLWTTDAPYRETMGKVRKYQEADLHGVDMEFSALLTVAAFRRIELAAIMVISDQVRDEQWQSGFKETVFKKIMRLVSLGLIEYLRQGGEK